MVDESYNAVRYFAATKIIHHEKDSTPRMYPSPFYFL
jgi:hypothetical protein